MTVNTRDLTIQQVARDWPDALVVFDVQCGDLAARDDLRFTVRKKKTASLVARFGAKRAAVWVPFEDDLEMPVDRRDLCARGIWRRASVGIKSTPTRAKPREFPIGETLFHWDCVDEPALARQWAKVMNFGFPGGMGAVRVLRRGQIWMRAADDLAPGDLVTGQPATPDGQDGLVTKVDAYDPSVGRCLTATPAGQLALIEVGFESGSPTPQQDRIRGVTAELILIDDLRG